jgi:FG-GAP-like repeat
VRPDAQLEPDEAFTFEIYGENRTTQRLSSLILNDEPNPWAKDSDFNGDRKSDILWHHENGQTVLWEMNGSGSQGPIKAGYNLPVLPQGWEVAGTGDVNGNGFSDILWHHDNGQTIVWEMNGSAAQEAIRAGYNLPVLPQGWEVGAMADVNGDLRSDILWHHDNGQTIIWEMNGSGSESPIKAGYNLPVLPQGWEVAGAGDFDGDLRDDILWHHANGQTVVWEMNGSTLRTATTSRPCRPGGRSAETATSTAMPERTSCGSTRMAKPSYGR